VDTFVTASINLTGTQERQEEKQINPGFGHALKTAALKDKGDELVDKMRRS